MPHIKYAKIRHLGDDETRGLFSSGKVVVQEKIDGANFAFYVEDSAIKFSSRSKNLVNPLERNKDNSIRWKAVIPILEAYRNSPEKFKNNLYYYGESMQRHTLLYDLVPDFVGFDVFSLESGEFLSWKIAKKEFELLGLPFINTYFEKEGTHVTIGELKDLINHSAYRKDGAEGVVIKRYDKKNIYGRPLFGKIVAEDFSEKNRAVFSGLRNVFIDEVKIANTYATPARIEKTIFKLGDEGKVINMALMRILFKEVIADIFEENMREIYQDCKSINFKTLETLVAKRCVKTLREVMERNIS